MLASAWAARNVTETAQFPLRKLIGAATLHFPRGAGKDWPWTAAQDGAWLRSAMLMQQKVTLQSKYYEDLRRDPTEPSLAIWEPPFAA